MQLSTPLSRQVLSCNESTGESLLGDIQLHSWCPLRIIYSLLVSLPSEGCAMRLGRSSVRWTVFLLVVVPLLAAVAIYAYAVAGQYGTAVGLANAGKVSGATIKPVSAMVAEIGRASCRERV